jgi:6-phospho-3-hexuloisomerase
MNFIEYTAEITTELKHTLSQIDPVSAETLAEKIITSKRIFTAGSGRSDCMLRAFAMRLMHMGFVSYVVKETVTPNIESGDLLLIGSGSGETRTLAVIADEAKHYGAALALITISPSSSIGRIADILIKIPAPSPKARNGTDFTSIQPMGSLFEQSLLITLDAVILRLMEKQGMTSNAMFDKHANLE